MSTTNELPPPNLEQKIDTLIDLVHSMRAEISESKSDARERYVDLRQKMTEMEARLTERMDKIEERQIRMEATQAEMRQDVAFLVKAFHTMDRKLDIFANEFSMWKDRVRELETTRPLH